MNDLRRTPLRRVLHRRVLLLGGEREPVLLVLLVSATLVFVNMNWPSAIIGAAMLGFIPLLRLLAKKDPQYWAVFKRSHGYRGYYRPRSRPYRDDRNEWDRVCDKLAAIKAACGFPAKEGE